MANEVVEIVLSYPRLAERIASRENSKNERERALKIIDEIKADFSEATIKTFEKFLDASLPKLYDGLHFDDRGLDFKKLVDENCVVLVPNHQSHADYLAINYMFFKTYRRPLYVAGGNNLNIFPIGTLFRRSGCFFIRRSFSSDILYKLVLEAYLYYLLKTGKPIEFFFEGGRSRTGKLLPPRYGLYHMLIDAHEVLKKEQSRPLIFVPVSIVHEYVPEQKSLVKELAGGKKRKESAGQLFGLVKLFAYQFGNVHIKLGKPIETDIRDDVDRKRATQDLAFACFREVGKNMMITPSSLLATVLLDEPAGALMWGDILGKCRAILAYCERFGIPTTDSLSAIRLEATLERSMDIFIGNKKVEPLGRHHHGQIYYAIREECRVELLYFKNTILHHFLVPSIINAAWVNLFNGQINNVEDLKKFFLYQRKQLKHEFYLPTVKQFFHRALNVVTDAIGRRVSSLNDLTTLSQKELYAIVAKVGVFGRTLSYINEAYYASALATLEMSRESDQGFKMETYQKRVADVFERERELGRVIRYPEGYSQPLVKNVIKYLENLSFVEFADGRYRVTDEAGLAALVKRYENDLIDQLTLNIRTPNL
jgi:glycerol-3-phosphate O-acyltransferase